ncbi:MAG: hypothetical protein K2X87_10600 [Gemmataceae bacterium]|nr:hypothetical protein [Gemmataceae bacterium]
MPPPRRFRAPTGNGEVLADPPLAAVPALVEENRRKLDRPDVVVGGLTLRELRALARRELIGFARPPGAPGGLDPLAPLLITGHQPELSHPGVWVKNFALHGLARRLGGVPLNLIVDTDTLKSAALRFPVVAPDPESVRLEAVPFDRFDGETPYEDRPVLDAASFASFPGRARAITAGWGYEPLLRQVWPDADYRAATAGEWFTGLRTHRENAWGCDNLELPVSRLSQTETFARFAGHILADLPRFRGEYNAAIREYRRTNRVRSKNHPAPELAGGEAPFWERTAGGRRKPATAASDPRRLRPRALTLTLFTRVCLGDFFLHGIGGGKYDEVTDRIIRDYFGIDPPAYQVLSATLHLPLPGFPATDADVKGADRLVRDFRWNPHRHLTDADRARPGVADLLRERQAVVAAEPPVGDHAARREWFRRLQRLTERLKPFVRQQVPPAESERERLRAAARANAVLRRRDYSWVLYPEVTLRPFLQRFLNPET